MDASSNRGLLNGGFVAGHWPELKLFGQFLREFSYPLRAFRTEWCIFAKEHSLAGCIDFVAKASDNSLILFDWKRTRTCVRSTQTSFAICSRL